MKKLFLATFILILSSNIALAKSFDYQHTYRNLPMADFSYMHGIDPGHHYDNKDFTWSPYPLLRLNNALYFKKVAIAPGYYNLTPREHKGKNYILFKEAGKVRHIVPAYKKEIVPAGFYDKHLPKPKLSFSQKVHLNSLDFIGKVFPSAKRKPFPKSYLEVEELDDNFVSIVIYYKDFRYYTIMRTTRL